MSNTEVLSQLKGQERVAEFLQKASQFPSGGYIFSGPDGVGKRTAAILFAAAINPRSFFEDIGSLAHPDVLPLFPFRAEPAKGKEKWMQELIEERENYALGKISPELKPSWVISIAQIRNLRREMFYPPRVLTRRAILLFDFDRIRDEAANAFLKTLEEPQSQTVIVITTSRPFAIPATIKSRCKLVRFNALPEQAMREVILDEGFSEDDVDLAVDISFGNLKKAFMFLKEAESVIAPRVLKYLLNPESSYPGILEFIDSLGFRVDISSVMSSFATVFRWTVLAKTGRFPRWNALAKVVKPLSEKISRTSLVHNIMYTEKMAERVSLNPTPPLFLYKYITGLKFT